jgi:hypothetical protein
MLVFNSADRKSVERAVSKARTVKPLARITGYGRFLVAGSKPGQRYEVRFSFNSAAELVVECECQANSKKGLVCYHAASCAGIFKGQWSERKAAAAAPAPQAVCAWHRGCENEREAGAYCLDHALELAADKSELFG